MDASERATVALLLTRSTNGTQKAPHLPGLAERSTLSNKPHASNSLIIIFIPTLAPLIDPLFAYCGRNRYSYAQRSPQFIIVNTI
jgi:hypothetical protein